MYVALIGAAVLAIGLSACAKKPEATVTLAPSDDSLEKENIPACSASGDTVTGYRLSQYDQAGFIANIDWSGYQITQKSWSVTDGQGTTLEEEGASLSYPGTNQATSYYTYYAGYTGQAVFLNFSLTVENEKGEPVVASASQCLYNDQPPEIVEFSSPLPGSDFAAEQAVLFSARVSDLEDAPEDLSITWLLDGEMVNQDPANSAGITSFQMENLEVGYHNVILIVTDQAGAEVFVTSDFEVYPLEEECNGIDDNHDGEIPGNEYDLDGDGFRGCEECDDNNPAIHPDAEEVCDGVDNDCDEEIDEEVASTFYADSDGDSFGNIESPIEGCFAPAGYVADATDCDDANPAVNPGAEEECNETDDDCDETVDEDLPLSTFYADADEDGYGNVAATIDACRVPSGYVEDASDCEDGDAAINPGAEDVYNDGIDQDCSGADFDDWDADGFAASVDCDDLEAAVYPGATEQCNDVDDDCDGAVDEDVSEFTLYQDSDGDGYGDDAITITDCMVRSGYVVVGGDCDDTDASIRPAATEICDGIDQDCDEVVDNGVMNTYYADADEDSYGDAAVTSEACAVPSGYVEDGSDCDDADPEVNPEAIDYYDDGVDNDCDGTADEAFVDDEFCSYAGAFWDLSDWSNGGYFNCTFQPDNVVYYCTASEDYAEIWLDNDGCSGGCDGYDYASGEMRDVDPYGYSKRGTEALAAEGPGIIFAPIFLYTGAAFGTPWNEIGFEILGNDPEYVHVYYIEDGVMEAEEYIYLGFNAADDFHRYDIDWNENGIFWYVDDVLIWSEESGTPTDAYELYSYINFWTQTGLDEWAGEFDGVVPNLVSLENYRFYPR